MDLFPPSQLLGENKDRVIDNEHYQNIFVDLLTYDNKPTTDCLTVVECAAGKEQRLSKCGCIRNRMMQ